MAIGLADPGGMQAVAVAVVGLGEAVWATFGASLDQVRNPRMVAGDDPPTQSQSRGGIAGGWHLPCSAGPVGSNSETGRHTIQDTW